MKLNIVPSQHGSLWIKGAVKLLKKKPSFFISSALLYILMIMGVSLFASALPLMLQPFPATILSVYFVMVIMLGCDFISRSNEQEVYYETSLLSRAWGMAFKNKSILILALINACIFTAIYFVIYTVISSIFSEAFIAGPQLLEVYQKAPMTPIPSDVYSVFLQYTMALQMVAVITSTITFILFCMAPAIVFWHQIPPAKAIFYNAYACLNNWRAWLRWGLQLILIFVVIPLVIGMIFGVLAALVKGFMVLFIIILVVAVITLVIFTMCFFPVCYYLAYKDCFVTQPQNDAFDDKGHVEQSNPFDTF